MPADGSAQVALAIGSVDPSYVGLDAAGNLYLVDLNTSAITELQRAQPPSLSFAVPPGTNGTASSAQSLTVQNVGNAALQQSGLAVSTGFAQAAGSGTPVDCSASSRLAAGASCNLSIKFTPSAAGTVQGSATLTNNSLNGSSATQIIALSGTEQTTQTITFNPIGAQFLPAYSLTLTATASSGLAVSYTSTTTGVCTVSGNTVTFLAAGSCSITASQAGNANYGVAPAVTRSFTIYAGEATLTSGSASFGNANVCPGGQAAAACTQSAALTFTLVLNDTLGTPSVVTNGLPNLDFTLGSSTCAGTVTGGSTCKVNVNFAPLAPGLRKGAIVFVDASGNVLGTQYISGVGVGPAVAFGPGVQTTIPGATFSSTAMAVDAAGNYYVTSGASVYKVPPSGCPTAGCQKIATGLSAGSGIGVDGAGNAFVADHGAGSVVKIPAAGCASGGCPTIATGLGGAQGMAVDGAGNLYVSYNTSTVVQVSPAGVQTQLASGLNSPAYLGVDGAGNVYVPVYNSNEVLKIPAGGGTPVAVGSGLSDPSGVAVDAAGNVFVTEFGAGKVIEIPADGSAQIQIASGSSSPSNPAVDAAGNLYVVDGNSGAIAVVQRSQTPSLSFVGLSQGTATAPQSVTVQNVGNAPLQENGLTISANFAQAAGSGTPADCSATTLLAAGASCNLSITFTAAAPGLVNGSVTLTNNALNGKPATQSIPLAGTFRIPQTITFNAIPPQVLSDSSLTLTATASSGLAVSYASSTMGVCTVLNSTVTLVAVGSCTITASQAGSALYLAASNVTQTFSVVATESITLSSGSANFGNANVCPGGQVTAACTQSATLTFALVDSDNLGTPVVVTNGLANLDFTLASGSTCTGSVSGGTTCTVKVNFAPLAPGLRKGAIELVDASGNVLATQYISGIGVGPAVAFSPGVQSSIANSSVQAYTLAVDAAGNSFITAGPTGKVYKVQPSGCPSAGCATIATGLGFPSGVGVDGAGNVFIADHSNNAVVKIPPAGCAGSACTTVASGLSSALGLAVDGAGNVYVSYGSSVAEISPAGVQTTLLSGQTGRYLAVDTAGNVYVPVSGSGKVIKIPAGGGTTTTVGTGLTNPGSVAVDAAGNVFIADYGASKLFEVPADGSAQVALAIGSVDPSYVGLDAAGNLYLVDLNTSAITELQRSQPPTLSFGSANESTTSAAQSVTVQNIGNASLQQSGLTIGANFTQEAGSGTPADCSATTMLAAGASCNLSISFTPTASAAGPVSVSATLTNNALNGSPATQSITLTGTALVAQTITFNTIAPQVLSDSSLTLTATASSGLPVSYASSTMGVCTVLNNTVTLVAVGSCTITASQAGNTTYSAAPNVTQTFSVVATETITLSSGNANFGNVNVCPGGQAAASCTQSGTFTFSVVDSDNLGTPVVLTTGLANLDFTLGPGSTCTGAVTGGTTCTVNVSFTPKYAGVRAGAVEIVDGSGNILFSTLISGTGVGAQVAYGPGQASLLGSAGGAYRLGGAIDAAGNIFASSNSGRAIAKYPAGGGAATTVATVPYGPDPSISWWFDSIAIDGAGNIYAAYNKAEALASPNPEGGLFNTDVGGVLKFPAAGGSPVVLATLAAPTNGGAPPPPAIALDAAGNVYVADSGAGKVYEIPANGGAQVTIGSGWTSPTGIAVDGAGNVFVADYFVHQVYKVAANGGAKTAIGSGFQYPSGVAVDAAGNVFVTDMGASNVYMIPADGSAQTSIGGGALSPYGYGVAVDAAGDLAVINTAASGQVYSFNIWRLTRSSAPTLTFPATNDGSTSAAQSVTVQNIGNATLTASALTVGTNFAQTAGSGTPADCKGSSSLVAGASCNLSIDFSPTAGGTLTGNATLTSNASNSPNSVPLSGTGTAINVSVTVTTSPAGLAYTVDGTSYTASQTFSFLSGSVHTLVATSPQSVASVPYLFAHWSDGTNTAADTITVPVTATSYTATFQPVAVQPGQPYSQQQKLATSDGATGDEFGIAVALSGDGNTALVGAYEKNSTKGAAYVLTRSNGTWTQQAELAASDAASGDYFGKAVALSNNGNTALVGAYYKNSVAGAAYVFTRSNGTWTQAATLLPNDPASSSQFGYAVALSGDGGTALVSAWQQNSYTGAAYVFALASGSWSQQQKLTASTGAAGDYFGSAVALAGNGNTALVGADGKTVTLGDQGAAFVYTRTNGTWSQPQELTASDAAANDYLGASAALSADGTTAVIGGYGKNAGQGAAYVFTLASGTWTQQQELAATDAGNNFFGSAAALSSDGNTALLALAGKNSYTGAALVFKRANGTFTQTQELTASDGATDDYFGRALALSADGTTALVGAYAKNSDQGAAYTFTLPLQFGSVNLGQSVTQTLTFNFVGAQTLAATTPYVVLTKGAAGLDFQAAATQPANVCVAGQSYSAGNSCAVNVTFTPARPYQRLGALQLMGTGGTPVDTIDLIGTGIGPMINYPNNSVVTTLGSGFVAPSGVAVDGKGDIFVADYSNSAVKEIVAVNGVVSASSTVVTIGRGFSKPPGVAVDGAGNVFVADEYNNAVKEIVAVNGVVSASSAVVTIGSGFSYPSGVAVDGAGDVFVADYSNNAVKEIVAVNGVVSASSPVITLGSGFSHPSGVGLDGSGNLFIGDYGNSAVKELDRGDPPSFSFPTTHSGSQSVGQSATIQNAGNATLAETALSVSSYFTQVAGSGTPADCAATTSLLAGASCNLSLAFAPTSGGPLTGTATLTNNNLNVTAATQSIQLSGTGIGLISITVATSPAGLTFTVDGSATTYLASQTFSWVAGSSHTLTVKSPQTLASASYTFSQWSDGTTGLTDSITVPATATTYTAKFLVVVPQYLLTTAANPAAGGTVTAGGLFNAGTVVPITATPKIGYYFVNWTGSAVASATSASTTVTMSAAESVTANFAQLATATYLADDVSTLGSWTGSYGADGEWIANGANALPGYATVSMTGTQPMYTWQATSTDPRALQTASGSAVFTAATFYGWNNFTINVNLSDGKTHRVALYLLDWDTSARAETVTVRDAATNTVLSTQTFSNFYYGQYVSWNITGNVTLQIAETSGANAVVSGIFFDPAGTAPAIAAATYQGSDTKTGGLWTGIFGTDGQMIANDPGTALPSYAKVSLKEAVAYTWAASTDDPRALQTASGASTQSATTYYAPVNLYVSNTFEMDVNLTDGQSHLVTLYLVDWDSTARAETISLLDANTGQVLDTESYAGFHGGQYVSWTVKGHVVIRLTDTAGVNAVVSGLFFDPIPGSYTAATATYAANTPQVQGAWQGKYGSNGALIPNDPATLPALPANVSIVPVEASPYTWAPSTTDARAVQAAATGTAQLATCYYSSDSMTFDVNLADGRSHQIALYLVDWELTTRGETVTVLDAVTATVLDTESYASFHNGTWAAWKITGHVLIRVSNTGTPNAVVSGVFVD